MTHNSISSHMVGFNAEYLHADSMVGEGNDNALQYSCLENPVDRGAWWAAIHGVAELDKTEVT